MHHGSIILSYSRKITQREIIVKSCMTPLPPASRHVTNSAVRPDIKLSSINVLNEVT